MSDLGPVAAEIFVVGVRELEQRVRESLAVAGVTIDDLETGRVYAERRTLFGCPKCFGHGIATRIDATGKVSAVVNVELCSCLEIRIVKRI